jgi:putative transcriptional regulator
MSGEALRDSRIIPSVESGGVDMAIADGVIQPENVRSARAISGLTQGEAANVVYTSICNWQNWEQGRNSMAPALYELFLLKTGQFTLREMVAGPQYTVMRLRLRPGHVIEMMFKHAVVEDIAGLASA